VTLDKFRVGATRVGLQVNAAASFSNFKERVRDTNLDVSFVE